MLKKVLDLLQAYNCWDCRIKHWFMGATFSLILSKRAAETRYHGRGAVYTWAGLLALGQPLAPCRLPLWALHEEFKQ